MAQNSIYIHMVRQLELRLLFAPCDTSMKMATLKHFCWGMLRMCSTSSTEKQHCTTLAYFALLCRSYFGMGEHQISMSVERSWSDVGTTQGDPLAMNMHSVGIMPLIHELQPTGTMQIWFPDDATGGGTLKEVRS